MGGAARFVRTLIPRGRYLPFGSCPCRSRGFDIWRPPAVQGHGGFATPTAEAAPPTSLSPDFPDSSHPPAANAVGLPSPACGGGFLRRRTGSSLPRKRGRVGVGAGSVYIGEGLGIAIVNILFCGDVVGHSGREAIKRHLPGLKRDLSID